ncbi:HlyD family secretion protein [Aquabacter sp. L1I39]|uniref:efflux RND transporter periplasmic adaptor subunit n=1 Tax=Aquabacter sp. L1I39 TaxID=2820278 RepID=UPI001AD9D9E1|nr:HlyD family secretion protein [Aquabacter sp. L1I39]QTL02721.1 HlyD family secretion protein [Aquabacter sp. L1I39]
MTSVFANVGRMLLTLVIVAIAGGLGVVLWRYYMEAPWTRDGLVHADVVTLAPDVSGLVIEVLVRENQTVKKGDVLFHIDPSRFEIALRLAEAQVQSRQAASEEAASILARFEGAGELAVTQEAVANQRYAAAIAKAAYDQAVADRDLAKLNLDRTKVRASVNGAVTNFDLKPGDYVTAGKGVFPLVDTDSLAVNGFFEETKLSRIKVGDKVRVTLMGGGTYSGTVEGIAAAISGDIPQDSQLLQNVNPVFNWVRLARRIPVRITLDPPVDRSQLISGRSATVEILERDPTK